MIGMIPFLFLFPVSLFNLVKLKGDIIFNLFMVLFTLTFTVLSLLIFTERHKSIKSVLAFICLVFILQFIFYTMISLGDFIVVKYGYKDDTYMKMFFDILDKKIDLASISLLDGIKYDISNFCPSIRKNLEIPILIIFNIIGTFALVFKERRRE